MSIDVISVGEEVHCDFCNKGADSMGGVMIGSCAVCGNCCEKSGYDKPNYRYFDEVDVVFDKTKTFKENVLRYRELTTGSRNGVIKVITGEDLDKELNKKGGLK